jgi:hypothetical protein
VTLECIAFHPRPFDERVEDPLVEREHLLAPPLGASLERNELGIITEGCDKSRSIAGVPGLDHPMVD